MPMHVELVSENDDRERERDESEEEDRTRQCQMFGVGSISACYFGLYRGSSLRAESCVLLVHLGTCSGRFQVRRVKCLCARMVKNAYVCSSADNFSLLSSKHTYVHTDRYTCILVHTNVHAYEHRYIHRHIQTHTLAHTYMCVRAYPSAPGCCYDR